MPVALDQSKYQKLWQLFAVQGTLSSLTCKKKMSSSFHLYFILMHHSCHICTSKSELLLRILPKIQLDNLVTSQHCLGQPHMDAAAKDLWIPALVIIIHYWAFPNRLSYPLKLMALVCILTLSDRSCTICYGSRGSWWASLSPKLIFLHHQLDATFQTAILSSFFNIQLSISSTLILSN